MFTLSSRASRFTLSQVALLVNTIIATTAEMAVTNIVKAGRKVDCSVDLIETFYAACHFFFVKFLIR